MEGRNLKSLRTSGEACDVWHVLSLFRQRVVRRMARVSVRSGGMRHIHPSAAPGGRQGHISFPFSTFSACEVGTSRGKKKYKKKKKKELWGAGPVLWGCGTSPRGHRSGLGPLAPSLVAVGTAERCKLRIFSVFHCSLPLNSPFFPAGDALASFPQPCIPPCPAAAMGCEGLGDARPAAPSLCPAAACHAVGCSRRPNRAGISTF